MTVRIVYRPSDLLGREVCVLTSRGRPSSVTGVAVLLHHGPDGRRWIGLAGRQTLWPLERVIPAHRRGG